MHIINPLKGSGTDPVAMTTEYFMKLTIFLRNLLSTKFHSIITSN